VCPIKNLINVHHAPIDLANKFSEDSVTGVYLAAACIQELAERLERGGPC